MSRYREIHLSTFASRMTAMGFREIKVANCGEHVFERVVSNGPNPGRFAVRIFSSIDGSGISREVGGDAIRVLLMDTVLGRPALDWRVYRTENALDNTRERARSAWGYAMDRDHHCPCCGALLKERDGKRGPFLGCTNFPVCRHTQPVPAALAIAA